MTPDNDADCTVRWSLGEVTPPADPPTVEAEIWSTWLRSDEELTVFFRGVNRIPYLSARIDREFRDAEVKREDRDLLDGRIDVGRYPLSEFMACRLLSRRGAVELHASSVIIDRLAYVFVGDSGAGKTTLSRLAEAAGAIVLSDDRTILAVRQKGVLAWGTPWHGTGRQSSSGSARVRGIFLIEQDSRNRVEPAMETSRALKELFVRLIQPRVRVDEVNSALDSLIGIQAAIPLRRFRFRAERSAFDELMDSLSDDDRTASARDGSRHGPDIAPIRANAT
ncbi:MAG: hypothetical protein ACRENI_11230 [Gemmatimonadaceae bacterium]